MSEKKSPTPEAKGKKLTFGSVFDKIIDICEELTCYALLGIAFLIVADVIMRYAFNKPFAITEPLAELIMVVLLAFGGVFLLREDDFIRVDIVVHALPPKVQMWMRGITDVIAAVVFFFVGIGAFLKNIELIQTKAIIINSGGNWRHAVYMTPLVIFLFLADIQYIRNAIHVFSDLKHNKLKVVTMEGEFVDLEEVQEKENY